MANNDRCGCVSRRVSNNGYGCLDCCRRWENYPYYSGPCPDANGCYCYDRDNGSDRRECCDRRGRCDFGLFSAMLPMAVTANGIIPLVRVPEGAALDSTITLNVNDASQSSAIAQVGGEAPGGVTAQAIFDVNERATVTLRSSEAINITDTSAQPLFTLSLVKLD